MKDMTNTETPKAKRRATPKAPPKPTTQARVAGLATLPWNAINEEIINAHNALLAALKGDA